MQFVLNFISSWTPQYYSPHSPWQFPVSGGALSGAILFHSSQTSIRIHMMHLSTFWNQAVHDTQCFVCRYSSRRTLHRTGNYTVLLFQHLGYSDEARLRYSKRILPWISSNNVNIRALSKDRRKISPTPPRGLPVCKVWTIWTVSRPPNP